MSQISGIVFAAVLLATGTSLGQVEIAGPPTVWHPITITFQGPEAAETDSSPNPFLDIRLQVVFTGPSNELFVVPGFFDGDGQGGSKGRALASSLYTQRAGDMAIRGSIPQGPGVAIELAGRRQAARRCPI